MSSVLLGPHPLPPSPFLLSPPRPLAVAEAVFVMAAGRLPAAGEILINSLFICVELLLSEHLFYGGAREPCPGIWQGIIAFAAGCSNLVG